MRLNFTTVLLCAIVCFAQSAQAASHKAHDLAETEHRLIKTRSAKRIWQQEMWGQRDFSMGEPLPDGLTRDELAQLVFAKPYIELLKMNFHDDFHALSAIKYPGRPGFYIAAGAITHYCDSDYKEPHPYREPYARVQIVVFKLSQPHTAEVIARTSEPLVFASGVPLNRDPTEYYAAGKEVGARTVDSDPMFEDRLIGLDHAEFEISPEVFAFGLRLSHGDGWAGGFGSACYLHLFTFEKGGIRQVFGSPIYDFQMLAGDWNSDGTRQHFVYEDNYVLCISNDLRDGHHGLLLRQTSGGKQHCRFNWDGQTQCYVVARPNRVPEPYYMSEHSAQNQ